MSKKTGFLTVNNKTYDLSKLSEEQVRMLEHMKLHEKHRGHEAMHLEMFLIFIATLVVAQILLIQWKQRHFHSYQIATLAGMWIIPFLICSYYQWFRFLIAWFIFSVITSWMTYISTRSPIAGTTPRRVYTWFVLVYKISYACGIVGYISIMGTLFGFNALFTIKPSTTMDFGIITIFYGLYFGVVARDFAEVCSETMAARIGYYTKTGVPTRWLDPSVCGICGNPLLGTEQDRTDQERTFKLNCSHVFHEFCVRGWCIVGKKQTCPYCKEKVDLKRMFKNPWEKPHMLYGNLLDWVRYLVAWQPLIIFMVQGINKFLGLD